MPRNISANSLSSLARPGHMSWTGGSEAPLNHVSRIRVLLARSHVNSSLAASRSAFGALAGMAQPQAAPYVQRLNGADGPTGCMVNAARPATLDLLGFLMSAHGRFESA